MLRVRQIEDSTYGVYELTDGSLEMYSLMEDGTNVDISYIDFIFTGSISACDSYIRLRKDFLLDVL